MRFHRGVLFAFLILVTQMGADWPQFRGADTTGVSADKLPTRLTESIRWTVDLPGRGLSGPIVVGNQVVLTASSGFSQDRLHVLSFDAKSGKLQWERQFWATGRTLCHEKMCNATPTSASDGKRIFAFFSSNDLICLDLKGNLLWYRGLTHDYQNASNSLGMSSSPVVVGDTLVVQVENDSESLAVGIDVETGENRWKLDRPVAANWTSPLVMTGATPADSVVVLQSSKGLQAVEPHSGKTKWTYDKGCSTIPSATVANGVVYVPSNGLTALDLRTKEGGPVEVWNSGKLGPSTPSPIAIADKVYTVGGAGVLSAADAKDGKSLWQLRLQVKLEDRTSGGQFSATPVAADGHIYLFNEEGVGLVINTAGEKGEVVSTHDFKEKILASPAISNNALYVRSDRHLWKVAN
ncbi:MAG: PQQ-binding-like beta-propeller repeat protein [Planctomycetota bacterium]|nr:PQQ-binding-like beta-propeller repeat protein [Planctomycetota bacterium]